MAVAAWVVLIAVAFITVAPIQFRPVSSLGPTTERFGAFLLVGLLFAIGYPRHFLRVAVVVLVSAALLEAAQVIAPTRHGQLHDLLIKLAGAAIGLGVGWALTYRRKRHPAAEPQR